MTEEEKEAIDYLENQDNSVNWNYPTLQAILSALNYIYKLQKENQELEKVIDLMAERLAEDNKIITKKGYKEYFYKKAEEENDE